MKYEIRVNGRWLEVSKDIFRSWTGKRRRNGQTYKGPLYYYLTRRRDRRTEERNKQSEA